MSNTSGATKRRFQETFEDVPTFKKRSRDASGTVVSWNMQGGGSDWRGGKGPMLRILTGKEDVSVILLQECTSVFGSSAAGEFEGWHVFHRDWSVSGSNSRCSLAILSRTAPSRTHTIEADWLAGRPVIGALIGRTWFWCVHAPSGGNIPYVQSVLRSCRIWSTPNPSVVMGDFNINLRSAAPVFDSNPTSYQLHRTFFETHKGGSELDYAYVSKLDADITIADRNYHSDHLPIALTYEP